MAPELITLTVRVEKTLGTPFGARILEPNPLKGITDALSYPEFSHYPDGTELTVQLEKTKTNLRFVGLKPDNGPLIADEEPKQKIEWTKVGTEYFSPEEHELFTVATNIMEFDGQVCLHITGHSGYGKTSRPKAWAESRGLNYVRINCALIRDPEEWFVIRGAKNGSTILTPTPLTEALRAGNAVIVLDEFNRLEPWLSNSLLSILDFERAVDVLGEKIEVGKNIMFVMTANYGYAYVGTFRVDPALSRRVDARLEIGPPPPAIEIKILQEKVGTERKAAHTIVTILNRLRGMPGIEPELLDITTRSALKIATLYRGGLPLRNAFQYIVINSAPADMQKPLIDAINNELGVWGV